MGTTQNAKPTKKATKKSTPKPSNIWERHAWLWKVPVGTLGSLTALILVVYLISLVSPWPSAMLIRYEFNKGGVKTSEALKKYVPPDISQVQNQQYRENDKDARLDVFYPDDTKSALPTVVWVHGGAWISGDKDNIDNYAQILAEQGYTVVSVGYSIAPEHKYPLPVYQVNDALSYLQQHAERLHIDTSRIVLAGDSAGSQIAAQVATLTTNESYAQEMGITPSLDPKNLRALLLNCGAYDLNLPKYAGTDGWFLRTVLWAYSGKKDFLQDPNLKHASVVNYVTADFPPAFITAGNADPLEEQSKELAGKLQALGVTTSTLFYEANHQPQLQHEYQFNLDSTDGKNAFERMTDFLEQQTAPADTVN
jgi:acetyl esterase